MSAQDTGLAATASLNGDGSLDGARILLIDKGAELRPMLDVDGLLVGHLTDPEELHPTVNRGPWDIIVAGPDQASADALERLAAIRAERPDMGLVMTINGQDPADLAMFVKARPDELVRMPTAEGILHTALGSTLEAVRRRRGIAEQSAQRVPGATPPPSLAVVHAVTGPTGGAGKTTVAIALAHLLAQTGASVILADLDMQFGEVAGALQIRPAASAYEVLFDDLGRHYDRRLVAEHIPDALAEVGDGFRVLAAPADPVQGDAIGTHEVDTLIGALRRCCEVLVLDCPAGLGERTLSALDRTDHHVVVSQVDVPAVAHLKTYLETIDRLGESSGHLLVLLNKEVPGSGVTGDDVVAVLGPVAGTLPFDPVVLRSLNDGRPVTAAAPGHEVSARLRAALQPLLPGAGQADTGPDRRRRSLFRRS